MIKKTNTKWTKHLLGTSENYITYDDKVSVKCK